MNICMMTNTYLPHVGGVARSVHAFAQEYRGRGHDTLVVAPTFAGGGASPADGVIRLPSLERFNGSDFSIRLPVAGMIHPGVLRFPADVVHSHHPFLMGDTAARLAAAKGAPLVFTHHTLYEEYTHYFPLDGVAAKRFISRLATAYADGCDAVVAPSRSIAALLAKRGVRAPIEVIPTGIAPEAFARGDGRAFRRACGIPARAFVIGHLGRLAPEKNLAFLCRAVGLAMRRMPRAVFLLVGSGPSAQEAGQILAAQGLGRRLFMPGEKTGQEVYDAYRAMDVFAFSSLSETQGMVLVEAMAAGVPVVALDSCGVREVLEDGANGFLLGCDADEAHFARCMAMPARRDLGAILRDGARRTALEFTQARSAAKALTLYERLLRAAARRRGRRWARWRRRGRVEWRLAAGKARALAAGIPRWSEL